MSDVKLDAGEGDLFIDADLLEQAEETEAPQDTGESTADLHFETKKFVLQALLEKASPVMPQKDILPVLKNFQIEAREGRLRVIATDLELSVISTTEMVNCTRPGTAVFPGKKMLDIIKEAEDGEMVVDVTAGTASIRCGKASWDLRLQDGSEYPPLPEIADVHLHSVSRVKFLGAVSAVRYAAADDDTRPNLMMIDVQNGKMTACDGVRFQQADLIGKEAREKGEEFPLNLQIPIAAVNDLVKLLRTTDLEHIGVGESDFHLVFRIGSDVFIANKLMAQFPDMEDLLLRPALRNSDELTVDRQELIDAVKRSRICADPETSAIVLELSKGRLTVKAQDKFGNTASESVTAGWTKGDRRLVVNHSFLMDMLAMADAKTCRFFLGEDTKSRKSPLLLKDPETDSVGIINQMRADFVLNDDFQNGTSG